jgi:hypothetical protein
MQSRLFPTKIRLLGVVAALVFLPFSMHAQQLAKRLILKDGSYQLVTSYEVKGERVRYYSAERGDWEELPSSMVDWPATEKYEKDRAAGAPPPEAIELDKELEAERAAEAARSPEVSPGLRLPEEGGVFLFDNLAGQPQLAELQQTGGQVKKNMKGNILRAAINPIASAKQTVELEGAHAKTQAHTPQPTFYINIDQDTGVSADAQKNALPAKPIDPLRFRIVRMEAKGDKRVAGNIKIAITGKVSQQQNLVPSNSALLAGTNGWVRVVPEASLTPGEYAVVEMLGEEGMNLYVWDFGVNPSAPANENAVKPDPSAMKPKPEKPVELDKR